MYLVCLSQPCLCFKLHSGQQKLQKMMNSPCVEKMKIKLLTITRLGEFVVDVNKFLTLKKVENIKNSEYYLKLTETVLKV